MNEADEKLLREMTEQSSEMWMQAEDRVDALAPPVIICCNPDHAFYLRRNEMFVSNLVCINGWWVEGQPLRMSDAASFFAAFGSHWYYLLNATFRGLPIRAFIKNGRSRRWLISQNAAASDSLGSLTESLDVFQKNLEQATEG